MITRFAPRYRTVDFNTRCIASAATVGGTGLDVHAVYRNSGDFAALIWTSQDQWSHPWLRYETNNDYSRVRLRFRWIGDANTMPLSAGNAPVLTVNYRVLPSPNAADDSDYDQIISILFNPGIRDGFNANGNLIPVDRIKELKLSIIPAAYDGGNTPLVPPVGFTVQLRDIRAGGAGVLQLARYSLAIEPHTLRTADGYDASYRLTPQRLVEDVWQLGYRGRYSMYVGTWQFANLAWNAGAGAYLIDTSLPPLNPAAQAWFADLFRRLKARNVQCWVSVSLELLKQFAPPAWAQQDTDGNLAETGWSPPTTLVKPTSSDGLAYLRDTAIAWHDLEVAAGLQPRYQIGEPVWWANVFTNNGAPCIYGLPTLQQYNAETGQFAPEPHLTGLDGPVGPPGPFLDWLNAKLGAATDYLKNQILAAHPTARVAQLSYTPSGLALTSEIYARLNRPVLAVYGAFWHNPAYDEMHVEDYDLVIANQPNEVTFEFAYTTLGYPPSKVAYYAGFVSDPNDAETLWPRIAAYIRAAKARPDAPAQVCVWARPQVFRDGLIAAAALSGSGDLLASGPHP